MTEEKSISVICLVDLVKQNVASPNGSIRYCDCFPPCSETRLARTITYGVYPSAKVLNFFQKIVNL